MTQLSTLVRNCLEERFGMVEVEGEITDFRGASSAGHLYFSLKDAQSRIGVVLFAGRAAYVRARIENGKQVRVAGKLTAYAGTSRYQIIAASVAELGVGDLALRFEELKKKLAGEGLFDDARKRPLPLLPRHVGVVTSPTGSVIRDFVNVLTRRFPNIDILVAPARVQGDGAAAEIARGVRELAAAGTPEGGPLAALAPREVIVVMRGGGSMEELWPFNEEVVARAVAASPVPVISGVGHQTDFTICDFVADLRAPTPSAAAELLVKPKADFLRHVAQLASDMDACLGTRLEGLRARLSAAIGSRAFAEPRHAVENYAQRIDALALALTTAQTGALRSARERVAAATAAIGVRKARFVPEMRSRLDAASGRMAHAAAVALERGRAAFSSRAGQLRALSPYAVLERGYSMTTLADGTILRRAADAPPGARLVTRLAGDERVASTVDGAGTPPRRVPQHRNADNDESAVQLELW